MINFKNIDLYVVLLSGLFNSFRNEKESNCNALFSGSPVATLEE